MMGRLKNASVSESIAALSENSENVATTWSLPVT